MGHADKLTKLCLGTTLAVLVSFPVMADSKRPVALIESLENAPETEFQTFDYAYKGDKIDLRPEGRAVLSFFDTCIVETVEGGLIKLKEDKADIQKGGSSSQVKRDCRTEEVALNKDAKEAGASVKRVSPFDLSIWQEWSLNTAQPLFKWPYEKRAKGDVTLRVLYVDADPVQVVWETVATGDYVQYPEDAPPLEVGRPYQVTAEYPKKYSYSAVFSIDPNLVLPEGPANRLVPLE